MTTMDTCRRCPHPRLLFLLVILLYCLSCSTTQALEFSGEPNTYARFPKWNACPNASLSFEFKTRQSSALLMYTDDNGRYDFLQLALTKGAVRLLINFVSQENRFVDIEANTAALNDGEWHRVEIRRNRMETILYVDGTQTSKVALGSDSDFGPNVTHNNYVFFGGVPSSYEGNLRDLALPEVFFSQKFRGEMRNILYFNCSCIPVRASVLDSDDVSMDRPEACELSDPCPKDCPCVSLDDGSGCECNYKRDCLKDILASYHLPMDEIDSGALVNPSGLDSVVEGGARLTRGVRDSALLIDGRRQWLRVTGGDHRLECMGDLARCENGYYMGMWLQFRNAGYQRGVYLSNGGHSASNHGVALLYSKGRLDVIFKMADGREWRTRSNNVLEQRWYHVAATWSQEKGLYLYINGVEAGHDETSTKRRSANENSRYNGFYIGRANDNSGLDRLGQVLVDDFTFMSTFKEAKDVRESGPIFHYYLPLDQIVQKRVTGPGLRGRVFESVSVVDGKVKGAVHLSGGREYLDLGDMTHTCLGNLDQCGYGVYVSLWVKFNNVDRGRKALLASPALGLHQDGNLLIGSAHNLRQQWETRYQGLEIGVWYFVELSWKPDDGLSLYVNRQRVDYQRSSSYRPPTPSDSMRLFVGRDAASRGSYPAVTVDELEMYYADRGTLTDIDFIQRGRPINQHFDMNDVSRGLMPHSSMRVAVVGDPQVVEGKVGSALLLDGRRDALDFGDHGNDCFGNLDLCPHGLLLSVWLKPESLQDRSYFLSSGNNGITISFRSNKLQVTASTTSKTWSISTAKFSADKWHFLEISFHPEKGLMLYLNGEPVTDDNQGVQRINPAPQRFDLDRFYIGRGNVDMNDNRHGGGYYDELDVWYADRDYLTAQGFIQRSRPTSVIIPFEEMSQDRTLITHPTLTIRAIGRPRLMPGKVGYALELSGSGRYADLGQQSHTCMGNLARCPQGITLSAWMKFRRFENNMVFLSTGQNGLLLLFRDGYVLASAAGQGQVSAPSLETGRWYLVEVSWHPSHGLKLFIDNKLVQADDRAYNLPPARNDAGHFYIGRPNSGDVPGGRYTTGDFDIDELEVWYARREDLLAFGYIDRDQLGCENFPMDSSQGDIIDHPHYVLRLHRGARLVRGRQGRALRLNGQQQYLDMGSNLNNCLGNLDKCPHGFTLSVWLKPRSITENMHYISAPSYVLFYEDSELRAEFNSKGKSWQVGTSVFRTGVWQRVTLAWHTLKGLRMYVDDRLVDVSGGVPRVQNEAPPSDHVFVGRSLADNRLTADVEVDDLQVCSDDLEQLIATGDYVVEVSPFIISFDTLRDGYIMVGGRRINVVGDMRQSEGLTGDSSALYFDGRRQYLDFGENFTCNGDLGTCRKGVTFRFGLRPETLTDGMYFVDSFPAKLYYKDGRLHGEMQTATQVWTVDTSDFKKGQWSRVEMTWHPNQGLALYVNGDRVDYQIYPSRRDPVSTTNWRTYLGRPLSFSNGTYARTYMEDVEFYNAHQSYVGDDPYMSVLRPYLDRLPRPTLPPTVATPRPTYRPEPTFRPDPTSRPDLTPAPDQDARIVRFNGAQYVNFSLGVLPPAYLTKTQEGQFTLSFLTNQPDGLLWYQDAPDRITYVAMKDGQLVFVDNNRTGRPQRVVLGQGDGKRFDDFRWHTLKIIRAGQRVVLTVDDRHREEYRFPKEFQFLADAKVMLGGTPDTARLTNGFVRNNYNGGMSNVIYMTNERQGNRILRNKVNLITQLGQGLPDLQPIPGTTSRPRPQTTTPAPRRTTSVSVVMRGVVLDVPTVTVSSGTGMSFNFKTINQNGLLMFGGEPNSKFVALELVDGRLYFVHNFGRGARRTAFSQKDVADGQVHEVEVIYYDTHVDLRVDNVRERMALVNGEQLPSRFSRLYVAGYPDYQRLPWMVWSRESYLGCLGDLRVGSRIIDFETLVQSFFGRVVRGCMAMSQACYLSRPCLHGTCRNTMSGYYCDCSRTAHRDERCQLDAWTALFNGSVWTRLDFSRPLKSHSDDLYLRFRSPQKDGLLFETVATGSNTFLRGSLENGRVKVETNLGGEQKTLYAGDNLNDLQWHTMYIKRRGNELEVWVDDGQHTKDTLAGNGYYLNVDRVFLGGKDGSSNRYIGYLQNFHLGDLDLLGEARKTGSSLDVNVFDVLPALIYHPVTIPDLDAFVSLPPLQGEQNMALRFMFKTEEPSGILLFRSGRGQDYLVVELFEGKLYIQLHTGEGRPLRVASEQSVNDGQWHAVTIQRSAGDQRQFKLTVDGVTSSVSYATQGGLDLTGPVYIGGAPQAMLQRDYIRNGVFSRTGFRGCFASIDLSGTLPDLIDLAGQQGVKVLESCQRVVPTACTKESCRNFGKCIESGTGTFTCDCKMSAHTGSVCLDEPIGFLYQNYSRAQNYSNPGLLVYTFPQPRTTSMDEIAFGVMTKQKDAILLKVFSEIVNDYIQFKLRDGYVTAEYSTDTDSGKQTLWQQQRRVNDGNYHIVRFNRTADRATLYVDDVAGLANTHSRPHGDFDRMRKIYIGGGYDVQTQKVLEGFDGILGGVHINGLLVYPLAKAKINTAYIGDVVEAGRPFNLTALPSKEVVIPGPTTTLAPPLTTPRPGIVIPGEIPPGIGGGGAGWSGGSGGPVNTVVSPGGDGGSAVLVPGGAPAGLDGPALAALQATPPLLPTSGARAGAVVGAVLGLLALASSMMWAFYKCKPGWSTCMKPPADSVVSSPLLSASNRGAVLAAGGGLGSGDGGSGGGGGMAKSTSFTNFYLSSSNAAGGGGAGGQGGTAIGTASRAERMHLASTASGVSGGGYSTAASGISGGGYSSNFQETSNAVLSQSMTDGPVLSPTSLHSYHFEGAGESTTADYDLVTGVPAAYHSNTLASGAGSVSGGSMGGGFASNTMRSGMSMGGAFSSNTMQSSYNYSVKNIRTVSGQQQVMGYAGAGTVGIPPGALGEEVRVDCCLMTDDGHSVVTGSSLGPPQVWDMQSGELLRIMQGDTVGSTDLHLACNDTLLVGAINADLEVNHLSVPKGVHNYVLQIWDFASGRALEMADVEVCSALTMMSDNDKVVFARSDKFGGSTSVVVWDLLGNQRIKQMQYDAPVGQNDFVHFLALSQSDRYVIAGFTNSYDNFGEFVVFDMTLTSYAASTPSVLRLDANPEVTAVLPRDEAVTGLRNGDLVIWSMRTGQQPRQLMSMSGTRAHAGEVKAVAVSKDNKYMVSGSADGTVKVWDVETERQINTLNGHTDEVWCCTISPDSEIVVSGARDRTIRLWKLKSGSEICCFNAGVDVFHVTMSRDKETIVALGDKLGARKLIMLQVVRSKVRRQLSTS